MGSRLIWRCYLLFLVLGTAGAVAAVIILTLNRGKMSLPFVVVASGTFVILGIRKWVLLPRVQASGPPGSPPPPGPRKR